MPDPRPPVEADVSSCLQVPWSGPETRDCHSRSRPGDRSGFGPAGTEAEAVRGGAPEDADGDGRDDLVCKFLQRDAGFATGDTLGLVTGTLADGSPFMAADRVRII